MSDMDCHQITLRTVQECIHTCTAPNITSKKSCLFKSMFCWACIAVVMIVKMPLLRRRLYLLGLFFVWKTLEICICHSSRSVLSLLLFTLPIQPSSKTVRSVLKNGSILGTLDAESFCSHWPAEPFWTIRNRSQRVVYTQYEFSLDTSGCNMPTTNYLSVVTDIHTYIIDEFN